MKTDFARMKLLAVSIPGLLLSFGLFAQKPVTDDPAEKPLKKNSDAW